MNFLLLHVHSTQCNDGTLNIQKFIHHKNLLLANHHDTQNILQEKFVDGCNGKNSASFYVSTIHRVLNT